MCRSLCLIHKTCNPSAGMTEVKKKVEDFLANFFCEKILIKKMSETQELDMLNEWRVACLLQAKVFGRASPSKKKSN